MAVQRVIDMAMVVTEVEDVGGGVKRFVLQDPDGWELPPARPGAHIDVRLPGGLLRTYSLCRGPQWNTRYEIAVKREPAGRGGSAMLHDSVRVGTTLGVSLPRGGLALPAGDRHVFIAGGIGVTPFLSAAEALLHRGERNFELHVIARGTPPLSALLSPLRELGVAKVYDSREGRPDLREMVGPARHGVRVYCCGPAAMLDAFEAATLEWPEEQVHMERFVPPPSVADPRAAPYTLVFARSGGEVEVPLGESMLAAIARHGVEVPSSCEGGICGACRVGLVEGSVLHHDRFLSAAEREKSVLVCVAGCAGGRLVLDL